MTNDTYKIVFTDTGKTEKTVYRKTIGAGQELQFTIINYAGSAIDCSSIATYKKVCIGNDITTFSNNPVNAQDLTEVAAASGTFKYAIQSSDFAETDVGTFAIQITLANNIALSDATSVLRASSATLYVVDTIAD